MIVILDNFMGNANSVSNIIKFIGYDCKISSEIDDVKNASRIIMPGVGSFDNSMKILNAKPKLLEILKEKILIQKTLILGICVGMQILFSKSEEGKEKGLDWIEGEVISLKNLDKKIKVPHIGWNTVNIQNKSIIIDNKLTERLRFYFVHSYIVKCSNNKNSIGNTFYGQNFTSIVNKNNIYGVQFHPEKSHKFGMQLFDNFLSL